MKKFIIGVLVFTFLFSIGILLARHKPLWLDELYGQKLTVQQTSWPDIILGHSNEWNSFPLFYVLQKGFLQLFNYQLPFVWDGSGTLVANPNAQVVLRILPDFSMSFALTTIVIFFGFRSGLVGGVMAAFLCLSTPMVWMYWAEARAYSLWFLLTVFQSLLFLSITSKKEMGSPVMPLILVHAGLCLAAPLGLMQTIVCQALLWCTGIRRLKFHVIAGLLPVFLGAYFIFAQPKMSVYLYASWQEIFFRNFSLEEMVFLSMYVVLLFLSLRDKALGRYFLLGRAFLPFCLVFIAIAVAGLVYAIWKSVPYSTPVVERHFVFLTPIGIIMTAAIFSDLWLAVANRFWWQLGLMLIFAAGLLAQFLSTFTTVYLSVFY